MTYYYNHYSYPASYSSLPLVTIILKNGTILRYSDRYIAVKDRRRGDNTGEIFEKRLLSISSIQFDLGDYSYADYKDTSCNIELSIIDDEIDNRYNPRLYTDWDWAEVIIEDLEVNDSRGRTLLVFYGFVKQSDGIKIESDKMIITAKDRRYKDDIFLGENVFTKDKYENLDDSIEGSIIPIVFGDWSDSYSIPAYCINKKYEPEANAVLKVSDLPVADIEKTVLLKRDSRYVALEAAYIDKKEALIGIDFNNGYLFKENDAFLCKVKGYPCPLTKKVATTPYEMIICLLDIMKISEFYWPDQVEYERLTDEYRVRRYIDEPISVIQLINEIAWETNSDLVIDYSKFSLGVYTIVVRKSNCYNWKFDKPSLKNYFREVDVMNDKISYAIDPDDHYINRITYECNFSPEKNSYMEKDVIENKIDETEKLKEIDISFKWLFRKADAHTSSQRYIYLLSSLKNNKIISGDFWRFMPRQLGEYIKYTDNTTEVAQIRSINKDINSGMSTTDFQIVKNIYAGKYGGTENEIWSTEDPGMFSKGWLFAEWKIIASFNDKIVFEETTGGGKITADIQETEGSNSVLLNIEYAMNNSSPNNYKYKVTLDPVTMKVKIQMIEGADNFVLYCKNGNEQMSNLCVYTLGFDISADRTGNNMYIGDYPALNENWLFSRLI